MRRTIYTFLLMAGLNSLSYGQLQEWNVVSPVSFETTLSGGYAEMRRNHFHGGLDFRTNGEENKPIYAVDDGYVCKVSISPVSYGKSVHIRHANGYTTTYSHLNGFVARLDSIVKREQYTQQKFEVEIELGPNDYPVRKGEQFAISGNTGSSGGPHLHFEVRKTADNSLQNPMLLNKHFKFGDTKSPKIHAVKVYGMDNKGAVNGVSEKKFAVIMTKDRRCVLQGPPIKVWGEIGFSAKATEYMNGTSFRYTPRYYNLYVDDILVQSIHIDNILFADTRAINSLIDYRQWARTGEFFLKTFTEKNMPLHIHQKKGGTILVDQEREYKVRYEVIDDSGNKDEILFTLIGEPTEYPQGKTIEASNLIQCGVSQYFEREGFCMRLPSNALYSDIDAQYGTKESPRFLSKIHQIGNREIPLHTWCDISLKVDDDTLADKSKYYITKTNANGIATVPLRSTYTNGIMVAQTNTFGDFAVAVDKTKPTISPLHTKNLRALPLLRFTIFDGQSGIASYDGYIDDKWVLFEYDRKTNTLFHWIDKRMIEENKNHTLRIVVKDNCGNQTEYTKVIYY